MGISGVSIVISLINYNSSAMAFGLRLIGFYGVLFFFGEPGSIRVGVVEG
jgi:hypothetical protein